MHERMEVKALKFSADLASSVRGTRGKSETIRVPLAYKYSVTKHDTMFFFFLPYFISDSPCVHVIG